MAKFTTASFCEAYRSSCVLLPAEKLGEHARVRHGEKNVYASPLGDAWYYAELAVALQEPSYLREARTLVGRSLSRHLPEEHDIQARLLGIYMPAMERRTDGDVPQGKVLEDGRRGAGMLLSRLINSSGHPKNPKITGRVGELIALGIVPRSSPASPREESGSFTDLNHDCYSWDGKTKIPVSVRYRKTKTSKIDGAVYKLYLGPYLYEMLLHRDHHALVADNEDFAWRDEKINQPAAIAVTALAFVAACKNQASEAQTRLISYLRSDMSAKIRRFSRSV